MPALTTERTDVSVRHATAEDAHAVVAVLAEAFADGPVARWLAPDPGVRPDLARAYFAEVVDHALTEGQVHVATRRAVHGQLVGVAVWLVHLVPRPFQPDPDPDPTSPEAPEDLVGLRLRVLDGLLAARHPAEAHHHLTYLAVPPARRGQAVGSTLLRHHHGLLDAAGVPAYLEANHPRNRLLYLRHGYVDSTPVRLPDGTPVWPMWRSPRPSGGS